MEDVAAWSANWGRARRRVGRPPAEMPDGDAAPEGLTAFLARFCKILNPFFDGILQKLVARGSPSRSTNCPAGTSRASS